MTSTAAPPDIGKLVAEIGAFYEKSPQLFYTLVGAKAIDADFGFQDLAPEAPLWAVRLMIHSGREKGYASGLMEIEAMPGIFTWDFYGPGSRLYLESAQTNYARLLIRGRQERKWMDERLEQRLLAVDFSSSAVNRTLQSAGEDESGQEDREEKEAIGRMRGKYDLLLPQMSPSVFPTHGLSQTLFRDWMQAYATQSEYVARALEALEKARQKQRPLAKKYFELASEAEQIRVHASTQILTYVVEHVPDEVLVS